MILRPSSLVPEPSAPALAVLGGLILLVFRRRNSLISVAALTVCATSAFGQGTVVFNNGTGLVSTWTSTINTTALPIPAGSHTSYVQLVYAPAGTPSGPLGFLQGIGDWVTSNPGWNLGGISDFSSSTEAGKFSGGVVTLTGIPAGANANYAFFGWSGGYDPGVPDTYFSELFRGLSSVFTTATGGAGTPPVPLADSLGGLFLRPTLLIPEPSTWSLMVIGAAAILLYRRK